MGALQRRVIFAALLFAVAMVSTGVSVAQAYRPVVRLNVTTPDGAMKTLEIPESGLATVAVSSRDYGLRPTMRDDEGERIAIAVFDMGSATEAAHQIGEVVVKVGGSMMASGTTPALKIQATAIRKGAAVSNT